MLVRDKYWELKSHEDGYILKYLNPENDGKHVMEIHVVKEELKSLYRLMRQTYD